MKGRNEFYYNIISYSRDVEKMIKIVNESKIGTGFIINTYMLRKNLIYYKGKRNTKKYRELADKAIRIINANYKTWFIDPTVYGKMLKPLLYI